MSKLCLFLPNISHAGIECWGNIPAIAKRFGYECIFHERQQDGFNEHHELHVLQKIITNHPDTKIVLISNSFGDIMARKLLLSSIADNISAHISICGFGSRPYISFSSKSLLYIAAYCWKYCYKNKGLLHLVAKLFNRPLSAHAVKHAHAINTHAAIQGMKKGFAERARYALGYTELHQEITTPAYILFSENDNNYLPQLNAEYIANLYTQSVLISLGNAGHSSFLEMPDKYDPQIEDIFGWIEEIH